MSKGVSEIMAQSLIIPSSGSISIDVKEAVEYQLQYILQIRALAYEQTGIVADFSALINATTVNFRCIRGGVANLADTPNQLPDCKLPHLAADTEEGNLLLTLSS